MAKNLAVVTEKNCILKKNEIHKIVQNIKNELKFSISSLQINLVSSSTIHKLNKEYLKHDFTTDIITFNYSGENNNLDGEIFISTTDAKYNANKYKVDIRIEILRLIVHGILHLLGHNDSLPIEKRKMKQVENQLVNKFELLVINKEK